jgi:hypothetical protein
MLRQLLSFTGTGSFTVNLQEAQVLGRSADSTGTQLRGEWQRAHSLFVPSPASTKLLA